MNLELGAHPGHHLHDDPGAGLLEHGDGRGVGDTLQAVTVHRKEAVTALQFPVLFNKDELGLFKTCPTLAAGLSGTTKSTWTGSGLLSLPGSAPPTMEKPHEVPSRR